MFKALLAASLAMLVCCAAAALAGPVDPAAPAGDADVVVAPPAGSSLSTALSSGTSAPAASPAPSLLDSVVIEGFVPVSLAATYESRAGLLVEDDDPAPLTQGHQPAVIPLPRPLYAAAILLVLAIAARRTIVRTCRA